MGKAFGNGASEIPWHFCIALDIKRLGGNRVQRLHWH